MFSIFERARMLTALVAGACGCATTGTPKESVSPAALSAPVLARAPGYSETPVWFEQNSIADVDGALVGVGRARIDDLQRVDAGFLASDSYARAELSAFVTTRVSSWFEDISVDAPGGQDTQSLRSALTAESRLIFGAAPVIARYWERRLEDDGEVVELVSLAKLRLEDVELVVDRVGLRSGVQVATILESLDERFRALEVGADSAGRAPLWAEAGDRIEDGHYLFVCYAQAPDEESAEAFARARCAEKLCRLFGVEISARTEVNESLESIDVERNVVERCPTIRAVEWNTRYAAGQCGPDGCEKWLLQIYPSVEYERERERLASPTILERTVVVDSDAAAFDDPAQCEDLLERYRVIEGVRAKDYEDRASLLSAAATACARIDPRETGLFERLTALLTQPIPVFTAPRRGSVAHLFASLPAGFGSTLDRKRFLTERITMVHAVVRDAVTPLRATELYERRETDLRVIERVIAPLLDAPFEATPVKSTHAVNWHEVLVDRLLSDAMPAVPAYREFLMREARARDYDCWSGSSLISAKTILEYLNKDEEIDEEEWEVAKKLIRRATRSRHLCWGPVFEGTSEKDKPARIAWSIEQIRKNGLALSKYQNQWDAFSELMVGLDEADMYRVFLAEYRTIPHDANELQRLAGRAASYLTDIDRGDRKRARRQCLKMSREMDVLLTLGVPERRFESWLCHCLSPKVNLDPRSRRILERKITSLEYSNCRFAPRRGS